MQKLIKDLGEYLKINLSTTNLVDDPDLEKKLNGLFKFVRTTFENKTNSYDKFVKDALISKILTKANNGNIFDSFKVENSPFKTYILELAKKDTFSYSTILKANGIALAASYSQEVVLDHTNNIVDSFVEVTGGGVQPHKVNRLFNNVHEAFSNDEIRNLVGCNLLVNSLSKIFKDLEGREYEFIKNCAYANLYQALPYVIQRNLYDREFKFKSIFSKKEEKVYEIFRHI